MIGNMMISNYRFQILKKKSQKGFSLLELVIAMFVLIILISVAVPTFQRTVKQAKETVLKENLWQMRRMIQQYSADKGRLPKSLDDLVEAGYMRDKPVDPIKEEAVWDEKFGEDINSPDGDQGLVDVKSTADGEGTDGIRYSEY